MSYVQVIEFVTREPDKFKALSEKYLADSEGRNKVKRSMIYHDRAEPRRYVAVIEFENREDAFENENLPETEDFTEGLAELSEVPLSYRSLELAYGMVP
ncbi:MAG TPA: hypothetical protein VM942_01345 [Acidimicrobiales bacterium]|nr:hypothetical protein [Acidimicrobiales bacterium]